MKYSIVVYVCEVVLNNVSANYVCVANVTELNDKGEGLVVTRHGQYVVSGVVPGDTVRIAYSTSCSRKRRKKYALLKDILYTPYRRITPFCSHYGVCGGCSKQHLLYANQLEIKSNKVRYLMNTVLQLQDTMYKVEELPMLGCDTHAYYRNRMDYSFGAMRWLINKNNTDITDIMEKNSDDLDRRGAGLHVKGFYDRVVHISQCYLQDSNAIRNSVHEWAMHHDVCYYNSRTHKGWIRGLTIRTSLSGEVMGMIIVAYEDPLLLNNLVQHVREMHPEITSLYTIVNTSNNDTIQHLPHSLSFGRSYIKETCDHISFRIYPKVFYQTNSLQAQVLYRVVFDMVSPTGHETILDLYCGIGSIGLYLARYVKKVIGIEMIAESIEAAKENACDNDIMNIEFICSHVEQAVTTLYNVTTSVDTIIVDPPRAGLHETVISFLLASNASCIVYVSCNPFTLVQNLKRLVHNYVVTRWRTVDMFPHTHHVETVVRLDKRQ